MKQGDEQAVDHVSFMPATVGTKTGPGRWIDPRALRLAGYFARLPRVQQQGITARFPQTRQVQDEGPRGVEAKPPCLLGPGENRRNVGFHLRSSNACAFDDRVGHAWPAKLLDSVRGRPQ